MTVTPSAVLPTIHRFCTALCASLAFAGLSTPGSAAPSNPILFATQVPSTGDFAGRASTFANHMTSPQQVARGGDLMIRYPDGTLRNLTQEAGFGVAGLQGANSIAVREPAVHWNGAKAVFSMVVGAPPVQYSQATFKWQLYEVTGLGQGQAAVITKVPNQPNYNNVSPFYGTDDRILFTSDRPHNGLAHLYPQLDEYESTPTVTGIWSLDPASGNLRLLNHSPSGAFSPSIDSAGRVIFTRWDHLQRDQQADADTGPNPPYGSFNVASEAQGAARLPRSEMFPEPRSDTTSATYGPVNGHRFNQFSPWQMNEDGTDEETLNHMGRHELSFGYLIKSFASDPKLSDVTNDSLHSNNFSVGMDTGLFHLREDPVQPGNYFAVYTREFATLSSGQIFRINGGTTVNPDAMALTARTGTAGTTGGRYRNPLPLANGELYASHTNVSGLTPDQMTDFRLKQLTLNAGTGFHEAGTPLTAGIVKSVTWWSPDTLQSFNGPLWELEAVEVVARARPSRPAVPLEAPERDVFTEVGVNEAAFRNYLTTNNLALIVTRNNTSRDRGDKLQPFNLRVPGGVQTVATGSAGTGRLYDIAHFQILQGDLVRGYDSRGPGRRVIAQPMHDVTANAPNPGGPVASVKIAADGSSAAFVPARRALAWQTTDAGGEPIVRERVWVTMQPGEVRVCASCHGVNTKNQANQDTPINKPEALRALLQQWKASNSNLDPAQDEDGDGIPNGVEVAEARNPEAKDNDVFTVARLFAMQQYRDFLGREGDASGVQSWAGQITGGLQTRAQVIESFFNSAEFQNGLPQVTRLYLAFFNRTPDYPGLLFHTGRFRVGVPLNAIAQDFAGSQEFQLTYGALTNGQYVDLVYQNVLGRPADPAGRANALAQLDGGAMTRGQLMVAFSESQEHLNLSASEVFVTSVYVGMLRRSPDPGGLENWINAFGTGMPRVQMLQAFLSSAEYHNRFLP